MTPLVGMGMPTYENRAPLVGMGVPTCKNPKTLLLFKEASPKRGLAWHYKKTLRMVQVSDLNRQTPRSIPVGSGQRPEPTGEENDMKPILSVLIAVKPILAVLIAVFALAGCAARQVDWQYYAYTKAVQQAASQPQQPTMQLELTEDGKVKGLSTYAPPAPVRIEQYRRHYHPAWRIGGRVLTAAVRAGGAVLGIRAAGEALEGIIGAGRGSYNYTAGGDINAANDRSRIDYERYDNVGNDYSDNRDQSDNSDHSAADPPPDDPDEDPPTDEESRAGTWW